MKKVVIVVLAGSLLLGGCSSLFPKPTIIEKNVYIAVRPDPALLDPNACPNWPDKNEHISSQKKDSEASNYIFSGYNAWACERMTRAKIKEQTDRQAKDIEERNKTENK